jgi:polyribonucleotide 5'-hydroxyl-kinase
VHSPDPVYINSAELPPTTWYPLYRNLKSAIYAPTPARIEGLYLRFNPSQPPILTIKYRIVTTLPSSQYISTSTTQPQLIALHLALERVRILAKRHLLPKPGQDASMNERFTKGPRVMVVGPPCSGKTTVVKGLVNLALSSGMGWSPHVVGLDPASVSISVHDSEMYS